MKGIWFFALNGARDKINNIDNEEVRDALLIIEWFKENLDLWKEEEGGEDNAAEISKRPVCHLVKWTFMFNS